MSARKNVGAEVAEDLDYRVRFALEYALAHFEQDLPLEELAKAINVSRWHLCRIFKASLGLSPARCVKLLRLALAEDLLTTTSLSAKEVMASVGLSDESHFVRDFHAVYGEAPIRYRLGAHAGNCGNPIICKVRPIIAKHGQ